VPEDAVGSSVDGPPTEFLVDPASTFIYPGARGCIVDASPPPASSLAA
jgi:hypothetical protein